MNTYETLFIAVPTLSEEEESETVNTLAQIVSDGGGAFTANERWGRKRLAYPILKHSDGVYVRFLYDAEPPVPKELERRMRMSDRILRSLTVRLEPNWATASKEQAVRDEQARKEAVEREARERAEREREEREREAAGEEDKDAPSGDGPEGEVRPEATAPADPKEETS